MVSLVFTDVPSACQRFEALSQQRERTKSNKYIFGSTLGFLRLNNAYCILSHAFHTIFLSLSLSLYNKLCFVCLLACLSIYASSVLQFSVENSYLSQLESLSQHIPKEILLTQDNIQLSNVIGEGLYGNK